MSDSLRERKKSERRNAILDVFADALEQGTIETISMDNIARKIDASRATVFNYFQTKADIVYAIADREIDEIESYVTTRLEQDESPLDIIYEATYRLVVTSFENSRITWQVVKTILDDPSRSDSPICRLIALLTNLVDAGKTIQEFVQTIDPATCARSILGSYFAELYHLASLNVGTSRGEEQISREEFRAVASQLVMQWTTKERSNT